MVLQFNRENHVLNLPDAFQKARGSNNDKILTLEKNAVDRLREDLKDVYDSLDLDRAYGKTLDYYGESVGQERGKATDDQYRVLIKSRIARNLTDGDYNSVVRAISVVFSCDPSEIVLTELDEPCHVRVDDLPIGKLNGSGIDVSTAVQIVKGLIPAGVTVEAINFSGTFEFAASASEYDAAAGFGDTDQTIGGTLGLLASSDGNDLPV